MPGQVFPVSVGPKHWISSLEYFPLKEIISLKYISSASAWHALFSRFISTLLLLLFKISRSEVPPKASHWLYSIRCSAYIPASPNSTYPSGPSSELATPFSSNPSFLVPWWVPPLDPYGIPFTQVFTGQTPAGTHQALTLLVAGSWESLVSPPAAHCPVCGELLSPSPTSVPLTSSI